MTGMPITAEFTAYGAPRKLMAADLSILQYPADEMEAGPAGIWLRRRVGEKMLAHPLLDPSSGAEIADGPVLRGSFDGLAWQLSWESADRDGLFGWHLKVANESGAEQTIDAVATLDVALTAPEALVRNEMYVSQYLDLSVVSSGEGRWLAVRQNMPGEVNPWLAFGSTAPLASWCTDALQLRADEPGEGIDLTRDLPGCRLQHEHTLAGVQTEPIQLAPGEETGLSFRALVLPDHGASSDEDGALIESIMGEANWGLPAPAAFSPVQPTVFTSGFARGEKLPQGEFLELDGSPVSAEIHEDEAWAYCSEDRHVVSRAKEEAVLRPHGQILSAAAGPGPKDHVTAATVWMCGGFAAQLTSGHACADPLLSVRRSYLGLKQDDGLRIFLRIDNEWRLLSVPSAWACGDTSATWWYRIGENTIRIDTTLSLAECRVSMSATEDCEFLLHARSNGHVLADRARLDGATNYRREADWESWEVSGRQAELIIALGDNAPGAGPEQDAGSLEESAARPEGSDWPIVELVSEDEGAQRLADFLPWMANNALIHYQVPRGLEQFTGGAWGTRDVCQGPVGLFLATGRLDIMREVLIEIFSAQESSGDWPQWFEYMREHRENGHRDSHGDIVYWPLLALGEYIIATGDTSILTEETEWMGEEGELAPTSILDHVGRALDHIASARSDDPRLPAYGHGDWNDALQPSSPQLAAHLVSTWTAILEIKALTTLSRALAQEEPALAETLRERAAATKQAIAERLIIDGELTGYALIEGENLTPLVHPRDEETGLHHGSLQMIHAIADEILDPQAAASHVDLIDRYLDGPTGIYLFNTPVPYHGGETRTFLRAEAASFWGREIGLMYTHAHLRWVEALLRLGDAQRAWNALQVVIPVGVVDAVPGAQPRQSNCYYSSSDAAFADRQEAMDHADAMFDPTFAFEGGWRIYSSGPGLVLRLVTEGFLGLRWEHGDLIVDPVLPPELDGLEANAVVGPAHVRVRYHVGTNGCGVRAVTVNGKETPTSEVPARYRAGGVRIPSENLGDLSDIALEVFLG